MAGRSTNYPKELRERAVRLVAESRGNYDTEWAAMAAVATKLGIGSTETLRSRVWYLIDADEHIAWVQHAGTGHPKVTD